MIRSALASAFAATALFAAQAQAAVNVTFTGTVYEVYSSGSIVAPTSGETITGSFTLDTSVGYNNYYYSDGSSYAEGGAYDYSNSGAVKVTGGAWFSDGTTLSLGGNQGAYLFDYLARYGYYSEVEYGGETYQSGSWTWNELQIDANGYSNFFTDPNGGVSFEQSLDLTGASFSGFFEGASSTGYYYGYFTPSNVTISSVPEPANIALLLAGVGLVGLRARRRQNAA